MAENTCQEIIKPRNRTVNNVNTPLDIPSLKILDHMFNTGSLTF